MYTCVLPLSVPYRTASTTFFRCQAKVQPMHIHSRHQQWDEEEVEEEVEVEVQEEKDGAGDNKWRSTCKRKRI